MRIFLTFTLLLSAIYLSGDRAIAQTPPADSADAGVLYFRAAKLILADSPGASSETFPAYPPFGAEWDRVELAAWKADGPVRELVHQARFIDHADWPEKMSLNQLRAIANDLGDAALYQHFQGEDGPAIEMVMDVMHLSSLLRQDHQKSPTLVQHLVAAGIDALMMDRLMVITADVHLASDAADPHALQVNTAANLISVLLDPLDSTSDFVALRKDEHAQSALNRANEVFARVSAERTFAALSLACQLFRRDQNRWPDSLDEFVHSYLPGPPIDPWGDGKQTFGYALIKHGLPDGGDRPLLYCRSDAADGLFYRLDAPQYARYTGDGSDLPASQQKQGGQFRDVTHWTPPPKLPTTRALN